MLIFANLSLSTSSGLPGGIPTLPLLTHLTNGCRRKPTFRLLSAQYGKGYRQVAKDGLNSKIDTWKIEYHPLDGANLTTLQAFLDLVNCDVYFTWVPLGETTQKKWRINTDSIEVTMFNFTKFLYSFTITQAFDLG